MTNATNKLSKRMTSSCHALKLTLPLRKGCPVHARYPTGELAGDNCRKPRYRFHARSMLADDPKKQPLRSPPKTMGPPAALSEPSIA